jgi:hypothetical protein
MSDELSQYELDRLQRIRDNHAKLVSLGLAKEDEDADSVLLNCAASKKKPKTSHEESASKKTDDDIVVPPSSRVLRSQSTTEHVQLSDAFSQLEEADMAEEERAERRAKLLSKVPDSRAGKRASRPPQFFADKQAAEIIAN